MAQKHRDWTLCRRYCKRTSYLWVLVEDAIGEAINLGSGHDQSCWVYGRDCK